MPHGAALSSDGTHKWGAGGRTGSPRPPLSLDSPELPMQGMCLHAQSSVSMKSSSNTDSIELQILQANQRRGLSSLLWNQTIRDLQARKYPWVTSWEHLKNDHVIGEIPALGFDVRLQKRWWGRHPRALSQNPKRCLSSLLVLTKSFCRVIIPLRR